MCYAVRYECKEAIAKSGSIVTKCGDTVYVKSGEWGLTSSYRLDKDILTFETEELANEFMKTWRGHPWYNITNGNYEVVEVKPKFKQVLTGYETV